MKPEQVIQTVEKTIDPFDRSLGALSGLPDIVHTQPSVIRVVQPFGVSTHLYSVQTFRQREQGDTIFLEHVGAQGTVRLVIPSAVAETIARQRESLSVKSRKKAMKQVAAERKAKGWKPNFAKKAK